MLDITLSEKKEPYIHLEKVCLSYERTSHLALFTKKHLRKTKTFQALNDISFSINTNETVGIIGRNGSGKSTISRVICNILEPSAGKVEIFGKVQLLALGVGFKPQLTGKENVHISGALLGMSRAEIADKMLDIENFAELGEFFYEPVRTYSNGMKSRLGFAVSTAVQPDILILDEVFSTGDNSFKTKAKNRIDNMRSTTKIVLIVSHNQNQIKKMCTRVIWLEKGQIVMDDDPDCVLENYEHFSKNPNQWLQKNTNIRKM